ncbi:transposase [Sulfoacidibacillus ferrooxidans]|uniref:transposase n=1 Tax=Sulfoacidibacillus ferrooxidans TaxID=2005001 RepID=UPI001F513327|nr:transposase [Sulfoacidibacillus ferrooxidans]
MGTKQTRYTEECKSMIVDLYHTGKTPSEIMSEYGLGKTALYKWVQERKEISVEQETLTAMDVRKLKIRIRELEEENDILKKAMTIFAKK